MMGAMSSWSLSSSWAAWALLLLRHVDDPLDPRQALEPLPGRPPVRAQVVDLLVRRGVHQPVGPGAQGQAAVDVVEGELQGVHIAPDVLGQDHDAVVAAQRRGPEGGARLVEPEPQRVVVDDLGGLEEVGQVGQVHHRRGVVPQQLEGESHVARREGLAVGPFDAPAQAQRQLRPGVVVLPALGQPVLVLPGEHVVHDQGLEDRRQSTHVIALVRARDVGVLVVEQGVLVGAAIHQDHGAVPGHRLQDHSRAAAGQDRPRQQEPAAGSRDRRPAAPPPGPWLAPAPVPVSPRAHHPPPWDRAATCSSDSAAASS